MPDDARRSLSEKGQPRRSPGAGRVAQQDPSPDRRGRGPLPPSHPDSSAESVPISTPQADEIEPLTVVVMTSGADALGDLAPLSDVDAVAEVERGTGQAPAESSPAYRRTHRRGRWVQTRARSRPQYEPAPVKDPLRIENRGRAEWCAIVLARNERTGEFRIVTLDRNGQRHEIARSASFPMPRSLRIRQRGTAREAHEALVQELLAAGWRPLAARGRWHDTAFIRYAHSPGH